MERLILKGTNYVHFQLNIFILYVELYCIDAHMLVSLFETLVIFNNPAL